MIVKAKPTHRLRRTLGSSGSSGSTDSRQRRRWHLWRTRRVWAAILWLVIAVVGPPLARLFGLDPFQATIGEALAPPSWHHLFGTDAIGRDVFCRVLVATQLDLSIAFAAVLLSAAVGVLAGAWAAASAAAGGIVDTLLQRFADVAMAFPLFVVALALAAVLGNSIGSVVIATAVINMPFYLRLTRTELLVRQRATYVNTARLNGWGEWRILLRVLLPNAAPVLLSQLTINLAWAMLNGAGLSFLGLGIRPPTPEWGVMVGDGARYMMTGQWWLVVFPGAALALCALAMNGAGDHLRDRFDPKRP